MECEEIKKIIPQYFQHTASEEEIQIVEEHLCVCHDCRTLLGELMDKASEAAEVTSQEQPESLPDEKAKPPLEEEKEELPKEEKPQEEVEEKKEEDIEYFPGEGLEASMDKIDEILGETEPAKGESGEESQELKPTLEEKADEEGSSFEVIRDIPLAPKQELPAESDIEALGGKESEPVKEEIKEPEEKLEVSPEEKEEKPEVHWESGLELEEGKPEEPVKEPILEEEEQPEEAPKNEVSEGDESGEEKESLEEVPYSLDGAPLKKGNIGLIEYLSLAAGLGVLGFLAYLLLKG